MRIFFGFPQGKPSAAARVFSSLHSGFSQHLFGRRKPQRSTVLWGLESSARFLVPRLKRLRRLSLRIFSSCTKGGGGWAYTCLFRTLAVFWAVLRQGFLLSKAGVGIFGYILVAIEYLQSSSPPFSVESVQSPSSSSSQKLDTPGLSRRNPVKKPELTSRKRTFSSSSHGRGLITTSTILSACSVLGQW
jgi:hypothetical protein